MVDKGKILNMELTNYILECIESGLKIKSIWSGLEIDEDTWYEWIKKGKLRLKKGYSEDDDPYVKLAKYQSSARLKFKQQHLKNIRDASETNWTASAWLLERCCGDEFRESKEVIADLEKITIVNSVPEEKPEDATIVQNNN